MHSRLIIVFLLFPLIATSQVKTGIEVLRDHNFGFLADKTVGLITNPTGTDSRLKSTVDILHEAPNVNLVALYGPEHGVRGNIEAGVAVDHLTDGATGIPVFSLYGITRKPTPEMLDKVEILVYDIQDIGTRSYTYISTLGLAMEAAAEQDIEFIVLDRPNPLGGNKFEGPVTEPEFTSFVSQYPLPYVHGFTAGELATWLNEEKLLKNGMQCKLTVVKMEGWTRDLQFEETGLPWIPSSPHIPHAASAAFYPASGILGELYVMNIGVGYTTPFQMFGAEWLNAEALSMNLNQLKLPGVMFRPVYYKPYYSTLGGTDIKGVQFHITDTEKAPLSLIQFYVLQEIHHLHPEKNVFEMCEPSRLGMFDKVCGTDEVRKNFTKNFRVKDIHQLWTKEAKDFKEKAEQYFLY